MSKANDLYSQLPAMREALESGKKIEFETHGHSMIPLLHDGGDKVILTLSEKPLQVNDVALCKTSEGRYVLHRIVEVSGGGYVLKGDNCVNIEFCKSDEDVIGVACGFIRRGKMISVTDKNYIFYVNHRALFLKMWRVFWRIADAFVKLFHH